VPRFSTFSIFSPCIRSFYTDCDYDRCHRKTPQTLRRATYLSFSISPDYCFYRHHSHLSSTNNRTRSYTIQCPFTSQTCSFLCFFHIVSPDLLPFFSLTLFDERNMLHPAVNFVHRYWFRCALYAMVFNYASDYVARNEPYWEPDVAYLRWSTDVPTVTVCQMDDTQRLFYILHSQRFEMFKRLTI